MPRSVLVCAPADQGAGAPAEQPDLKADDGHVASPRLASQSWALGTRSETDDGAPHLPALPFFLVAIGASAGGLEALQDFFRHIDPHGGVSFVVIQHLSADFKSMMPDLLGRHTRLSVAEIRDGMQPAPDCVHVIAPNHMLTIEAGRFRVLDWQAARGASPINLFLESLVAAQGDQCGAIILSGTGIDGTHGARLVKEVGGLVMAQEPGSAKFDGMPSSVIGSGSVDFIGNPRQLAERLHAYVRDSRSQVGPSPADASDEREAFDEIVRLLRQQSRINFSMYRPGMVMRRIRRRAALSGLDTLESYVTELRTKPAEVEQLTRELLVGVTQFFRDPAAWAHVAEVIIPQLVAAAEDRGMLRLWVAGCATGEEAYTLAMLLEEHAARVARPGNYRIFATDVRRDSLRYARAGVYPAGACLGIPDALRDKYFEPRHDQWVAKPALRDSVTFAPHDLLSDPPFTQISMIVCRNTLIYLTAEARRQVLSRFRVSLRDGGFLFLGPSEVAPDSSAQFGVLDESAGVLVARGSVGGTGAMLSVMKDIAPEIPGAVTAPQRSVRTTEALYEAAVQLYAPPGVAVDSNFELLQVFGRVADFVSVPPGRVTISLLKMVPRALAPSLGAAGRKALRNGEEVVLPEVRIGGAGGDQTCKVRIVPVDELPGVTLGLLIFFEPPEKLTSNPPIDLSQVDKLTQQRLEELEDELVIVRESSNSAIADVEATNQELQAANDDLRASSEALESTNEELQSVNEALYTVNSEYKRRIEELEQTNTELESLLRVVDVGVLFLDESLIIRRFNSSATRLFPLRAEDVGRPLTEIAMQADYPGLAKDARDVLAQGSRKLTSVHGSDGAWWSIGLRTARDSSGPGGGMIVTMHEISELRRVLSELSRLEQVQEIAEAASGTGHAVLDLAAEVVHFSGGARRLLGFPEGVMCVPLEASLALFGVDAGEEPALALDDLREGHRLPVSIETDVILIEGHVVRLRIDVCSRTDAASGSRFVVALLTRPGAARLSAGA